MDLSKTQKKAAGTPTAKTLEVANNNTRPAFGNASAREPLKLSRDNLPEIAKFTDIPEYDVTQVTPSIIHIGLGAFASAHIAVMADDILAKRAEADEPLNYGIIGVSLKKPEGRDALLAQDNLYSMVTKGETCSKPRIIGSIHNNLVAKENPQAVLEAAANPDIKTISLTVTQNGYYFDKNGFDFCHEDIKACLDESSPEMSSIGLIVSALALRKERNIDPPLILSLDNLAGNGTTLRNAVLAYSQAKCSELHSWIADNVSFPNNMVDRITPKTTDEHKAHVQQQGLIDTRPIQTEPEVKLPLVIGDNSFKGEAPELVHLLEKHCNAIVTPNVLAYEELKVRTLNGVHMATGCVGHLSGFEFSHEAMANPNIRRFAMGFMEEAGTTLTETNRVSHDDFREDVLRRLDNSYLCDQLTRLSRNGTTKVGTRFLSSVKDIIASEENSDGYQHLSFAIAAWIEYAKELGPEGHLKDDPENEPNDPNAATIGLVDVITPDMTDPSLVFAFREIFGKDLSGNKELIASVEKHLTLIHEQGIENALDIFLKQSAQQPSLKIVNAPKV